MTTILVNRNNNFSYETDEDNGRAVSARVGYDVHGATDLDSVIDALQDSVPTTMGDMRLRGFSLQERITNDLWQFTANYSYKASSMHVGGESMPEEDVSYDTTDVPLHVTHSRQTVHRYGDAPEEGGAIDVDKDGNIKGCDASIGVATMDISHYFSRSQFDNRLRDKILFHAYMVNNQPFRGFEAGEVLYKGASINPSGSGRSRIWSVVYHYMISPNSEALEIEGFQTNVAKKGWEYVWVRYGRQTRKSATTALCYKPIGVYVERIYPRTDLSKMGISAKE